MGQEVVLDVPGCHKDYIEQLLNLRVPYLSVLHDLTDNVHMLLFDFHHGFRPFNGITVLTTVSVATMYNSSTSSDFSGISVHKDFRYCWSSMKVTAA
jgi:hypothetical protein